MLLLPLCYIQFGYYGQFIVQRWRIQEAARTFWLASLPDTAFVRLDLAAVNATGKWEEEGKECWYRGHLYDVVRRKVVQGTTWVYCLDDEREEHLIRDAGAVTKANQDQPAKQTGHMATLSLGDLLCETPGWEIGSLPVPERQYSLYCDYRIPAQFSDIVIPPPKADAVLFG